MGNLPRHAYPAASVREFDRRAIEDRGIEGLELMRRAGKAAFDCMRSRWPRAENVLVFCGPGNNGGDGYVVATLALQAGCNVTVMALSAAEKLSGDARRAHDEFTASGGKPAEVDLAQLASADVVVDAMLGTGLERDLEGRYAAAVAASNKSGKPVMALDIPTGLHADTGRVLGQAIRADATVTFIALKAGLLTGEGPRVTGELFFNDLDVPDDIYSGEAPLLERLQSDAFVGMLPQRPRTAHKGNHGHVLVVGGNLGMPGAVRMAGEAALRVGAGLVTVATHADHAASVNAMRPELMVRGIEKTSDLSPLLERATVVALGPGLGSDRWAEQRFAETLATGKPLIVDADGLNLLSRSTQRRENWVLTPHPGEAARLLDCDSAEVQADRIAAVRRLAKQHSATVVLKGAGSLVAGNDSDTIAVCDRGNPGMATAGMGDVLTGVIAGLVAQGLAPRQAAGFGVFLHAAAGDAAAGGAPRGLVASDLMSELRQLVNAF